MAHVQRLIDEALHATNRAIEFDKNGNHEAAAAYYYRAAADLLDQAVETVTDETNKELWGSKADSYRKRANKLEQIHDSRQLPIAQSSQDKQLSQCYFLFDQGLLADEAGDTGNYCS